MYLGILTQLVKNLYEKGLYSEAIKEVIELLDDKEKTRIETTIKEHIQESNEWNKRLDEEVQILKEI